MTDKALYYATLLDSQFREAAQIAKNTASFLENNPNIWSDSIYQMLRSNIEKNESIYGSAVAFEPYSYRSDRRLFCPYVYRKGDGLAQMDIGADAYDYTLLEWEWYSAPRSTLDSIWTDPYFDEGAGNILMCTYSVPFLKDKKLWGVTTVDIELEPLQQILSSKMDAKLDFVIVTSEGQYVYHPDASRIMKASILTEAVDSGDPAFAALAQQLTSGASGVKEVPGWGTDEIQWVYYAPIPSTGWGFAARLSRTKALAPVHSLMFRAAGILTLSLILIIGVVWRLSGRISRSLPDQDIEKMGLSMDFTPHKKSMHNRRKILIYSIMTMTFIALSVIMAANYILYKTAFEQKRQSLIETAGIQARLIEAMARFNRANTRQTNNQNNRNSDAEAATISQVIDANQYFSGLGDTGEFTLAQLKDDQMVFILKRRHQSADMPDSIPFKDSPLAEPMRNALSGKAGTIVGLDYRGAEVLAAYEPIKELKLGIVAKVDIQEIKKPFLYAGGIAVFIAAILNLIGGFFLVWVTNPLIKRVEESEQQFRTLVSNIPGVTYRCLLDENWTMLYISEAIETLTGYPPSDFINNRVRTFDSVIHPRDRKMVADKVQKAVRAKQPYTMEYRLLHRDGHEVWVHEKGQLSTAGAGRADWLDGAIFDISEQRHAEAELRQLSRAVEQSSSSVVITDLSGRIEYVNPCFTQLTGYTTKEAIGKNPRILKSGEHNAEFYENLWKTIRSGNEWRGEFCNRRKDGSLYWEMATISPVRNEDGEITHFVAVKEDITQQKNAEAELHEARHQAEVANQAKSEFLANMSHEIRTPMNAILGFSDLLKSSQLSPKEQSYLDAIRSSGNALLTLINDILDLSKVEAGKLELQYESFSLSQLLAEIQTVFTPKAKEKALRLELEIDPDMPDYIYLDEVRLRQILFNIVGNALKFTHAGSVTLRAGGHVDLDQSDRMHLVIEVEDTGIGIPQSQQEKIFDSFIQASGQSTRKYGGSGLGLAITKRLTEMMHGKVTLESEHGKGSCFRFEFPEVLLTAAPDEQQGMDEFHSLEQIEPSTILYADDEELNRTLLQGYFDGTGHTLLLAENGKHAIEMYADHRPDLVLMDIRMPVMGGIDAAEAIKAISTVPVLALTASSMKDEQKRFSEICDMHLSKPVSRSALARALKQFLPLKASKPEKTSARDLSNVTTLFDHEETGKPILKSSEKWSQLLEQLNGESYHQWQVLCEAPNMDEAEKFAAQLEDWARSYHAGPLLKFAQSLERQIDSFDIEGLTASMKSYPKVIEYIESKVMKS
ncbi:PAS domain S-box protein [Candidatus Sumerlaeota bacterium]|nr:PAS domain S-box protein [Candidatus Sumerlaeota bacterium]